RRAGASAQRHLARITRPGDASCSRLRQDGGLLLIAVFYWMRESFMWLCESQRIAQCVFSWPAGAGRYLARRAAVLFATWRACVRQGYAAAALYDDLGRPSESERRCVGRGDLLRHVGDRLGGPGT